MHFSFIGSYVCGTSSAIPCFSIFYSICHYLLQTALFITNIKLKLLRLFVKSLSQLNMSLFACQDGTAAMAKQSKKGKKDAPVSQYPSEVINSLILCCINKSVILYSIFSSNSS